VQAVAVLVGSVCEVLAVLVEGDVLSEVVEVLILVGAVANACVASFDVGRSNQAVSIGYDQFLVMSAPHIFV
jgi:hypothetical protein